MLVFFEWFSVNFQPLSLIFCRFSVSFSSKNPLNFQTSPRVPHPTGRHNPPTPTTIQLRLLETSNQMTSHRKRSLCLKKWRNISSFERIFVNFIVFFTVFFLIFVIAYYCFVVIQKNLFKNYNLLAPPPSDSLLISLVDSPHAEIDGRYAVSRRIFHWNLLFSPENRFPSIPWRFHFQKTVTNIELIAEKAKNPQKNA